MKTQHSPPLPAVHCFVVVAAGLVVGLHVFGGWPGGVSLPRRLRRWGPDASP